MHQTVNQVISVQPKMVFLCTNLVRSGKKRLSAATFR